MLGLPIWEPLFLMKTSSLPLSPYKNRGALLNKLKARSPITHVCEVGVKQGKYAELILKTIPSIEKIYLVDVWAHQLNYKDNSNVKQEVQERHYQDTLNRLKPWQDKVIILKGMSVEMAANIPDESLDWVYIDARHDYCGCMEDIHSYWPKIKNNGVMSGHDYHTAIEVEGQDWSLCADGAINQGAVKGAVDEFAESHQKQVLVSYGEKAWYSWSIVK